MMKREPLLFHIMLRQGFNWFTLASNDPPTETCIIASIDILTDYGLCTKTKLQFPVQILPVYLS